MIKNQYLTFQLDGKIDDTNSPFNGDGREAYWKIARKQDPVYINEAFKQGFYQFTHHMFANELNEVYAHLNSDDRPTGQFCSSMSTGDLIFDITNNQWFVVGNTGFNEISILAFKWKAVKMRLSNILFEHHCGFFLEVQYAWVDRFVKKTLSNKYQSCTKCRVISQHGEKMWEDFGKNQM